MFTGVDGSYRTFNNNSRKPIETCESVYYLLKSGELSNHVQEQRY